MRGVAINYIFRQGRHPPHDTSDQNAQSGRTTLRLLGIDMGVSDDQIKDAAKQAIKEFLDEKFAVFGKWSFGAFSALLLAALVFFVVTMNGWHK